MLLAKTKEIILGNMVSYISSISKSTCPFAIKHRVSCQILFSYLKAFLQYKLKMLSAIYKLLRSWKRGYYQL